MRDALMRWTLAAPGWVLDRLDRQPQLPSQRLDGEHLHRRVRDGARWPEAYLALEDDLHVHLGNGVLAYQLRGRTAFAVGGLNTDTPAELVAGFRADAEALGARSFLVFPVRAGERAALAEAGFASVQVGVEAWIDLADLSWAGGAFEDVRRMRNKARREGVVVEEVAAHDVAVELKSIWTQWLASKTPSWRMKLLVGSPSLQSPWDRRYFVARCSGRIDAFVTVTPGASGVWGIDVMCRRPDAARGAMEALIGTVADVLAAEGKLHLSLGPCPMAGVPPSGDRWLLRKTFGLLYHSGLGNTLFGFRSLYRFKAKFRPRWEPVWFAASPSLGVVPLYQGCRMWGLY